MHLASGFLHNREIHQLKKEELEDLEYHLQNVRQRLLKQMEQLQRELKILEDDQMKIRAEIEKRFA
jgi:ribosome recycling factor